MPPAVPVHLTIDALGERERLAAAARVALGDKARVGPWELELENGRDRVKNKVAGAGLLRQFLPENEGGLGPTLLVNLGNGLSRPRPGPIPARAVSQGGLPAPFHDQNKFSIHVGLGQRIYGRYASYFINPLLEPGKPRDLMLRGDFAAAGPAIRTDISLLDERVELTS